MLTYQELLTNNEDHFVVAVVMKRNTAGKAVGFALMGKHRKKEDAKRELASYGGLDALMIPVFPGKEVAFIRMEGGEVVHEPLMTHQETASFFRTYYKV